MKLKNLTKEITLTISYDVNMQHVPRVAAVKKTDGFKPSTQYTSEYEGVLCTLIFSTQRGPFEYLHFILCF